MKPTPRVVLEVCSLCGLDWRLHGRDATAETCVKLLLDEVRSLNARLAHRPIVVNRPYPIYPTYPRPFYPGWWTAIGANTTTAPNTTWHTSVSIGTPQAISISQASFAAGVRKPLAS